MRLLTALAILLLNSSAFANHWEYNGSTFQLEAVGASRKFHYQNPRGDLPVSPGTVVFSGTKSGNTYSGTAYTFSKLCGPKGYRVTGIVSEDQRNVTLYGNVPVRNAKCKITDYKRNVLTFVFYDDQVPAGSTADSNGATTPTPICLVPVFTEEERLRNRIDGNRATTEWVAAAINYLLAKYCLVGVPPNHDQETSLSETCIQYSGIFQGERVYWGGCYE